MIIVKLLLYVVVLLFLYYVIHDICCMFRAIRRGDESDRIVDYIVRIVVLVIVGMFFILSYQYTVGYSTSFVLVLELFVQIISILYLIISKYRDMNEFWKSISIVVVIWGLLWTLLIVFVFTT